MARKKRKIVSRQKAGCPFCWEWLPLPKPLDNVFTGDGCSGGQCECGAWFVLDETGHEGGLAQLDVRALACDGDLEGALGLVEGKDFELKTQPIVGIATRQRPGGEKHSRMGPQVWAVKLKKA